MPRAKFIELRVILRDPERYNDAPFILYLPKNESWAADTRGL